MVELSMNSVPLAAAANRPSVADTTCLPLGSMVTTMSAWATAAGAVSAMVTPRARAASMAAGARSKPVTSCPALTRLPAMGAPILPSPMKPILAMMASLLVLCCLCAPVISRHRMGRAQFPRAIRAREMMSRMISLVPSRIWCTRRSRTIFSTP